MSYTCEELEPGPFISAGACPLIARALHRRLPERIRGAGTLYLWLRKGRTALRVARKLTSLGREHEFIDACARIPLGEGEVQLCTEDLCGMLSEAEVHDTRALFVPGDRMPQLPDFGRDGSIIAPQLVRS